MFGEGVNDRIDVGARLGLGPTACICVTTRGVRAPHLMHKVPGDDDVRCGRSSVSALTFAPSSRSVSLESPRVPCVLWRVIDTQFDTQPGFGTPQSTVYSPRSEDRRVGE